MSAPWPYDDADPPVELTEPSWVCPGGTCQCNESEKKPETKPFEVLLRDHFGEAMGGARCRVILNGRVVNEGTPYADGSGWLRLELPRSPHTARVEWAPADTPIDDLYPYRKSYYADLREDSATEAARRRLHNVGFSYYPSMEMNIKEFQREFGYAKATGRLRDIEADLTAYHDDGVAPTPPPKSPFEDAEEV